jgi:hypothetical protein
MHMHMHRCEGETDHGSLLDRSHATLARRANVGATAAHLCADAAGELFEGALACVPQRDSCRVSLGFPQENSMGKLQENRSANPREKFL